MWTGFVLLRVGLVAGSCERGIEIVGSIKYAGFLV